MINPAQYQQVLQKMPDPQLMQLLKRPDKIPSQFVIQEINRRKQMRQAEQARKQQVANAVAMQQQQPVQPTTPEGQPAVGLQSGGLGRIPYSGARIQTGGLFSSPQEELRNLGYIPKNIREDERIKNFGRFSPPEIRDILKRDFVKTGVKVPGKGTQYIQKPDISNFEVRDFLEDSDIKFGGGEPSLLPPPVNQYAEDTYESDTTTGIKSVDTTNENETIDNNAIEKGKKSNSQLDKLVASLGSQINDQIAKTKEPFNASSVLEGFKQSEFFDETSEAYKNLNTKSKERIDAANKAGLDLIKERQKYAAQLEKEGRTPENIVFTSLIQMGLSLMASPEVNFTQALGQAGQAGFATFQNLRKEQKDLVKEKYKRAYEIAESEYNHKMNISKLENELDVQKVNAATTINNLARTEKKDFIDQRKVEFEMQNLKDSLALEKQKLKLDQTTKGIAAFLSLNDEERKDKTLELKEELNKAQIESLTKDKSDFAQLVEIGTSAGLKKEDIVNSYLESKFGKEDTYSEDLKAIAGLAKELAKDYTFDDDEDVDSFMTILNKVTRDVMGLTQEVSKGESFDVARKKVTG